MSGAGTDDGECGDSYRTVGDEGRVRYDVSDSTFIGRAAPVETTAGAEAFLDRVWGDHPDATHVVPAYRVRSDPFREYSSDDGEPNGSAGSPALSVLVGRELENVVVAVVRYSGKTNLGVGGLADAYSTVTAAAIDDAEVVERRPQRRLSIVAEYDDSGTVRGILESTAAEFDADYDTRVHFDVRIPREEAETLTERLRSATSDRIDLSDG
ncbi:MAG: IMPACT family protein [Natronomonas sp.]